MTSDTKAAALASIDSITGRTKRWGLPTLLRWESALVIILFGTVTIGVGESPHFLKPTNFFYIGLNMGEIAIMALPLTLIVMVGEIDLSVASMLGLSGAVMGALFAAGHSIWFAMAVAILIGGIGGALNGLLVAKLGLPSIAVTIGTLTLFRGLAEVVLAPRTVTGFPLWLTKIGAVPINGTELAYSTVVFGILAAICAVVLHYTPLGRAMVAIGLQPEAARFAGIRVNRIKFWLYVLSGVICAFAGILFTLKNASVSYDAGTGLELDVVAIVLFGGVSIFGGRGTVGGVVLSIAVIGCVRQTMTQANVQAEVQNIIIGLLLLVSVIVPNGGATLRWIRTRTRRYRLPLSSPASTATKPGPFWNRKARA